MDPLSIATGAAGLATTCAMVGKAIYNFASDTADVDTNVAGLCDEVTGLSRVLESVSNAAVRAPQVVAAEIDPEGSLWISVRTTLDDIKRTLDKLDQLLDEVKKAGTLSRGFLRRPAKQIKLGMRSKDVTTFKDRIKWYNGAMITTLQMINVCLLIHSNSSQEATLKVLSGLKVQVGRVEQAVKSRATLGTTHSTTQDEDGRATRNLKNFIRVAETFHSSASTILKEGPRSTIWGGSIRGEPLTQQEFTNIERWIPSPIKEENTNVGHEGTLATTRNGTAVAAEERHGFESDDDMEQDLIERLEDLAVKNNASRDYSKAEAFYCSAINRSEAAQRNPEAIQSLRINLADVYMRQKKWAEAETIIIPIAWERKPARIDVFHILHGLAIAHMASENLESADKFCKRALWGKRRLLGKTHGTYCESLALLATIYDLRNMTAEAEAHRSFLPPSFQSPDDVDAVSYLEWSLDPRLATSPRDPSPSLAMSDEMNKVSQQTASDVSQNGPAEPPKNTTTAQHLTPLSDVCERERPSQQGNAASAASAMQEKTKAQSATQLASRRPLTSTPSGAVVPKQRLVPRRIVKARPSPQTSRIIIGVHYGLKLTAVTFAVVTGRDIKEQMMQVPDSCHDFKIPTVLLYNKNLEIIGWGVDDLNSGRPKAPWEQLRQDGSHALGLADFLKNGGHPSVSGTHPPIALNLPPRTANSGVEFTRDFLRRIRHAVSHELEERLGDVFNQEQERIAWLFSFPASRTRGIEKIVQTGIREAGFSVSRARDACVLLSEPEASARACFEDETLNLDNDDEFLVVQCGDELVEAVTYKVDRKHPFTIRELTNHLSGNAGSSCVSHCGFSNFRNLIWDELEKVAQYKTHAAFPGKIYPRMVDSEVNRLKTEFRNDGKVWTVEQKNISFSNDIVLSCWAGVTGRITTLVNEQIALSMNGKADTLKHILFTGDFAVSDYLFSEVLRAVPLQYRDRIVRPKDPTTTVAKGLVRAGARMVQNRAVSYLVEEMQPFDMSKHREWLKVRLPDGTFRAKDTLTSILAASQTIRPGGETRYIRLARFFQFSEDKPIDVSDREINILSWNSSFIGLANPIGSEVLGCVEIEPSWLLPERSTRVINALGGTYYMYEFTLRAFIHEEEDCMDLCLFLGPESSSKTLRVDFYD